MTKCGIDRRARLAAKGRQEAALERLELRLASEARAPATGATSFAVKVLDAEAQRLIDEALARRSATS